MLFPLDKTRVKPGTVLVETVLSGDSLYIIPLIIFVEIFIPYIGKLGNLFFEQLKELCDQHQILSKVRDFHSYWRLVLS